MFKRILFKLHNKCDYLLDNLYTKFEPYLLYNQIKSNASLNTIYLFSNPVHSNLGDQAQTYCILKWLKENYPSYEIICAPQRITSVKILNLIRERLKQNDILFVHSGYLIFDPHPELPYICEVLKLFNDRRIVILPQTINLNSQDIITKVQDAFNNHSNLTLLCRDDISYSKSQKLFPTCHLLLWPDFVTSLIGTKEYHGKRNGILFCLRNDIEKFYSDDDLNRLKLEFKGCKITKFDTTISKSSYAWKFNRKTLIKKTLNKFAKYQLVITDRYHGTIFSQITATPVIVLSSSDHKLSSGVKWFPKQYFSQNVFFANDLNEAYQIGLKILERNGKVTENPSYFRENYFSKLKSILTY